MARDASIERDFADGTYTFRLAWGELIKLQEACDAGPYVVLQRLLTGAWRVEDISNVIRLGLMGGGVEPVKALKMSREYVEKRPPFENLILAQEVLGVACMGAADEEPGKPEAPDPTTESTPSQTESSE